MRPHPSLLALALVIAAPTSTAQTVGLYLDPAGALSEGFRNAFTPFDIYLVVQNHESLQAFEGSLDFSDPAFVATNVDLPSQTWTNYTGVPEQWIVGIPTCVESVEPVWLVDVKVCYMAGPEIPDQSWVCLGPASPSSFPAEQRPGYYSCGHELVPWQQSECLTINPCDDGYVLWTSEMPKVDVETGEVAVLPLDVHLDAKPPDEACSSPSVWYEVRGIDWDVGWDPDVASFEAFELDAELANEGWTAQTTTFAERVLIEVRNGVPSGRGLDHDRVGALYLRAGSRRGGTPVKFDAFTMDGGWFEKVAPTYVVVNGYLRVGAVATAATTFGALKSRF